MKYIKVLFILFLITGALTVSIPAVNAHESIESGPVTLLVHFQPGEDTAVVGKPVSIYVDLLDTEKGFSLEKCNCKLFIQQNGEIIFTAPLVSKVQPENFSEFNTKEIPYTFSNEGNVTVGVSGDAVSDVPGNTFKSFSLYIQGKILPIGSTLPISDDSDDHSSHSASAHAHHSAYPKLELAVTLLFTLVMLYFIFGKNKKLAQFIARI